VKAKGAAVGAAWGAHAVIKPMSKVNNRIFRNIFSPFHGFVIAN
jgi:hypothetical protein